MRNTILYLILHQWELPGKGIWLVYVFIAAVPITKLFAWGEGDSGGHVL